MDELDVFVGLPVLVVSPSPPMKEPAPDGVTKVGAPSSGMLGITWAGTPFIVIGAGSAKAFRPLPASNKAQPG